MEYFQRRVKRWVREAFGPKVAENRLERNHRFLEEALELVQANGCPAADAHQLVDYVYGRDIGGAHQEVGGVLVTLAALCCAYGIDMQKAGTDEIIRCWDNIDRIRAKQAAKLKDSALPGSV
jgi:hypothetical protein